MTWFSASLLFVISVGSRVEDGMRTVVLLQSVDHHAAFEAALACGYAAQTDYLNGDGELVQRRFQMVETIDELGETIDHGREVYSEPHRLSSPIVRDESRRPKDYPPGSSGV